MALIIKTFRWIGFVFCAVLSGIATVHAQPASVYLEDLTWPELKARIETGYTTVILPTGGTEQNGPHLTYGKHNFVVNAAAGRIAAALGHSLVAPVITIVPEGTLDQPEGNLNFSGTLGLSDDTFEHVLRDVAESLARSGFKLICIIGDHGQSQPGQARVALQLTEAWKQLGIRVINVSAYYDPELEERELLRLGFSKADLGDHGGIADTAELLAVKPDAVRKSQVKLEQWNGSGPSGANGRPELANAELGERLLNLRVLNAVKQIQLVQPRSNP